MGLGAQASSPRSRWLTTAWRFCAATRADLGSRRRIDATGHVVVPGFIDMHSHSGLVLLDEPKHEAKTRQGVTTEVIGVDGNSYAPFDRRDDLHEFVRLNAGLDGHPPIQYDWDSVASYLSRFDGRASVNVAYLIGNSALRICAVGWDNVPASPPQIADMRAMLREGMAEGAFGVSSGLDYPPGAYATTEELAELAGEAARGGGIYHTHVRYQLGDRYLDPFREAIDIGRRSSAPVHLTHLYRRATFPGGARRMLELVEDARADGLDVTFDTYPYEWSSTRLLILLPLWIQEGKPDQIKERLADRNLRIRLRKDLDQRMAGYAGQAWRSIRIGYLSQPHNLALEGRTLGQVVEDRQEHLADVLCDILIDEDLSTNEVAPGPEGATLPHFVAHPLGMIGSDSVFIGDRPSPRTYGSFPRVLADFVREERLLSLPDAVRKMTSYPAQRLGLSDRGLLRDGMKADIVIFDPEKVRSRATFEQPREYPEGIPYVIVNGEVVIDDGRHTGASPGRALRNQTAG